MGDFVAYDSCEWCANCIIGLFTEVRGPEILGRSYPGTCIPPALPLPGIDTSPLRRPRDGHVERGPLGHRRLVLVIDGPPLAIGVVPHPHGAGVVDAARFPRRRDQHDGVRVSVSERMVQVRAVAVRVRGVARWTNEDLLLAPAEAALVGRVVVSGVMLSVRTAVALNPGRGSESA